MLNFIYDEAVLNYAPQEQISIILEGDKQRDQRQQYAHLVLD
jgi:hypothetical protein